MKNLLKRIWAGVVAAVAGASLGLVVQMVGMMSLGWSIDRITAILAVGVAGGFVLGVLLPPKP